MDLFGAVSFIIATLLECFVQIINSLVCNIIIFESSSSNKFDWNKLFHNNTFWIFLGLYGLYVITCICIRLHRRCVEKKVRGYVIQNITINIQIGSEAPTGRFESGRKSENVLNKIH